MLPLNRWLILIVKLNVLGLKAIDSIKKSKWFSSQSSLEAFKKYIWIYKEQKGHPRFIRLPKKKKKKKEEKQLCMNGKMMTLDILWALYSACKKIRTLFQTKLFKQRYISSVKS